MAKEGTMFRAPDNSYIKLKLIDGIRYEEGSAGGGFNPRETFTRFSFKSTSQKLDLSAFKFRRSNQNDFRSNFIMMNTHQLLYSRDSVKKQYERTLETNYYSITPYIKYFSLPYKKVKLKPLTIKHHQVMSIIPRKDEATMLSIALGEATSITDITRPKVDAYLETQSILRRYVVEYQKKFTLSAACLMLFLIGAPLGAIIRKGGLGLPVVISVIFFLIYYIISTIGEKSAKEGSLSPFLGTWIAILILTPVGIFLSYKAANDSVLFDAELYKRFFLNLIKRFKPKERA